MNMALLTVFAMAAFLGVVLSAKFSARKYQQANLLCYQLHFPADLRTESVERFLTGVSGLLVPWWKRWFDSPYVVIEATGTAGGIDHFLLVTRSWADATLGQLRGAIPSARYGRVDDETQNFSEAAEYRLNTSSRQLRVDPADTAAKLLTGLQPLAGYESIVIQLVLTPSAPVSSTSQPTETAPFWSAFWPAKVPTKPDTGALKEKRSAPLLLGAIRIGVKAKSPGRSHRLLRQVEVGLHSTRAPGVHLARRNLSKRLALARITRRVSPLVNWPGLYNTHELAGLVAWPIETTQLPGLTLALSRQLAPSPLIPTTGSVIAHSTYPGYDRPIAIDGDGRLRHVAVLGPTGSGKSTLIANMAIQDLVSGVGLVLIDPKGDLVDDVLARMPDERRGDVVVLDPSDVAATGKVVGLNPLRAAAGANQEVVVENLVGLFRSLWKNSWGPRSDDIFRAAFSTLATIDHATLCEVPALLTDANFRRSITASIDDPVGLSSFWGWYESLSEAERASAIGPVMNKIRAFTMRPSIRAIVGQARPKLTFGDALATRKVVLVSMASGLLGEEAASLLGALVVAELWHATTARAALAPDKRPPVMAYLDEFQRVIHLPTPMAQVLAEARGLGLGVVLANQHLAQLSHEVREATLANARTKVAFQLSAGDARIIGRYLGGVIKADDLMGLGGFEVVISAFGANSTQPPATGRTLPLPKASADPVEIRAASAARYGCDRGQVEGEIRSRQQPRGPRAPLRRKASDGEREAS